jgi:hypothetical protein
MKPVYIRINKNGDKFYFSDREMTIFHREDGPAIERADGSKSWYLNDKLHREDGPAFEWADGTKEWYLNGKRHRDDGPAFEWADGYKSWWLNDDRVTEQEHARLTAKEHVLTLDEIAKKFNVPVNKLKIKK